MTEWWQEALLKPEVVEATLKVGLIPSQDHAQLWWEIKDPTTAVLIASASVPHVRIAHLPAQAVAVVDRWMERLLLEVEPF